MNKEQVKELAEINATYTFDRATKQYGEFVDEYVRHFYNKLAELRVGIDDVHTCNCKHNSNSRDNQPCCRCDSRQTNADRIRNMSDEELAEFLAIHDLGLKGNDLPMLTDWFNWLQSEAEQEKVRKSNE